MVQLIFPVVSFPLRPVHNTYAGREMVLSTSGRITVNASIPRLDPSNTHRHSLGRSSAQTGNGGTPKRRPVGWIGGHASPVPIVPVHEIAFLDAAAFRTGHGRICAAYRLGIRGTHTPVHAERPQERQRERSRPVRVAPGHDTAMAAVTSFWF